MVKWRTQKQAAPESSGTNEADSCQSQELRMMKEEFAKNIKEVQDLRALLQSTSEANDAKFSSLQAQFDKSTQEVQDLRHALQLQTDTIIRMISGGSWIFSQISQGLIQGMTPHEPFENTKAHSKILQNFPKEEIVDQGAPLSQTLLTEDSSFSGSLTNVAQDEFKIPDVPQDESIPRETCIYFVVPDTDHSPIIAQVKSKTPEVPQQVASPEEVEHSQNPDPVSLPMNPDNVEKENIEECLFCKSWDHSSANCTVIKHGSQRMQFVTNNRLCKKCLKPIRQDDDHHPCTTKKCVICNKKHNTMLCNTVESLCCEFCKSRDHGLKKCPKYFIGVSVADRRAMLEKEDRCFHCLRVKRVGNHDSCRNRSLCRTCMKKYNDPKRAAHHRFLCLEQETDSFSETNQIKQQQPDPVSLPMNPVHVEQEGVEKCVFCKSSVHNSANCTLIKRGSQRMAFVTRNRLCKICLKPTDANGFHELCTMNSCKICYNEHNTALCSFVENRHCAFCNSRDHYYQGCPQYLIGISVADRKARLEKEKRCLYCFKRNRAGHHDLCQKRSLCRTCMKKYNDPKRAAHHRFLCLETGDLKKCLFCDSPYHLTANCSRTQLEKRALFVRKNFCMKCLQPIKKATHFGLMVCKERVERCTKCKSPEHNRMLCTAS